MEGDDTTINVTYETLFELLRREKNRDELQKLSLSFYEDVQKYIAEKNKVFLPESKDLFSDDEREKTQKQIGNTKRIIRDLFERREKKIIIMALNKARTSSSMSETSILLEHEKTFFENLFAIFSQNRKGILENLTNGATFQPITTNQHLPNSKVAKEEKPTPQTTVFTDDKQEEKPELIKNDTLTIRFLAAVPKFLGKQMEVYGPFNEQDMANLPSDIASVLIKKGRAEEVTVD